MSYEINFDLYIYMYIYILSCIYFLILICSFVCKFSFSKISATGFRIMSKKLQNDCLRSQLSKVKRRKRKEKFEQKNIIYPYLLKDLCWFYLLISRNIINKWIITLARTNTLIDIIQSFYSILTIKFQTSVLKQPLN